MKPPALPRDATLAQLAHATATPEALLRELVARRADPYRVFMVRKRSGGRRAICVPCPELMHLQRFIHRSVLQTPTALAQLGDEVTAYRPGASHIGNAARHAGARWMLKLDLKHFFESVSERQVWHVFRRLGYAPQTALWLTRLCTRVLPLPDDRRWHRRSLRWVPAARGARGADDHPRVMGHLPQGAPTSPMLANLACVALDAQLRGIAQRHALTYTRYADDLCFSSPAARPAVADRAATSALIAAVARAVGEHGFGLRQLKTQVAGPGARRIVTGLSVAGEQPRLPRARKDALRQALHHIARHGLRSHCDRIGQRDPVAYLGRLAGQIRYLRAIEPQAGDRLLERLKASAQAVA